MKLYLLTVQKMQSFYVVADNPLIAQQLLEDMLTKADWWFSNDRKVVKIELIAREINHFPGDKPVFGGLPNDLIIIKGE